MTAQSPPGPSLGESAELTVEDELEFLAKAEQLGWGDGLPLIPPTEERVRRMLSFCARDPADTLGEVPPFGGEATFEKVAVNAVMAGCVSEAFPVVCAAVAAALHNQFNLYGIQATTSPVTPFVLVNGPAATSLGLNAAAGAFGSGNRGNATIGRALRLVMTNIGGGRPVSSAAKLPRSLPCLDYATQGFPAKYTFCSAENEAESPWSSRHVEQGCRPDDDAVTVFGVDSTHDIRDVTGSTASEVLIGFAATMGRWGTSNVLHGGEPVLVLSPDHAQMIASEGWTKDDVRWFLFERARSDMSGFPQGAKDLHARRRPVWVDLARVPVANRPGDIEILVIGGRGIHAVFLSTMGSSQSPTVRILTDDHGRYVDAELVGSRRPSAGEARGH